jgi:hypothetical protein
MEQDQSTSLFGMQADAAMQSRLANISRWAKFISIAGIIIVLFAALFFILLGNRFFVKWTELMGYSKDIMGALIIICIVFIGFAIVWFYLLLRASTLIKQGLQTRNHDQLAEGFKMLRLYFLLSVVVTIGSFLLTIASRINF